jgi:4-nitrophenyl phosphatase
METPVHRTTDAVPGTVVFDLDGVIYLGSTAIPGASSTIAALAEQGWQVLFATNNSTKTPESVARVLSDRTGKSIHPSTVITSGMAATQYLNDEGIESVFIIGSQQLSETLNSGGVSVVDHRSAEAVVVGLDRSLTPDTLERASSAIRSGALFIATNTDETFPTPEGPMPGAGATVQVIAEATGSPFVDCGKPHAPMAQLIMSRLETENVWMIGDRLETDIALAKSAGWTSVLTLTGVTPMMSEFPESLAPDHVIASVADLPQVLAGPTTSSANVG